MIDLALSSYIYINDIWSAAIQELDIIFGTEKTELIGYPDVGTYFDEFLWTLSPTTAALQSYIDSKIADTVYASQLQRNIEVNYTFNESTYENIYEVTISLYNDYKSVQKTYNLNKKVT